MHGLLQQLLVIASDDTSPKEDNLAVKMQEVHGVMQLSDDFTSNIVAKLRDANTNPLSNYYWLIFVFIYAGAYFWQ